MQRGEVRWQGPGTQLWVVISDGAPSGVVWAVPLADPQADDYTNPVVDVDESDLLHVSLGYPGRRIVLPHIVVTFDQRDSCIGSCVALFSPNLMFHLEDSIMEILGF